MIGTKRRSPHRFALVILVAAGLVGCGGVAGSGAGAASAGEAPQAELGLPGERHPLPGVATGGTPTMATFARAADAGYRTVVSLLIEGEPGLAEEREAVEAHGMRFVHIPVAGEAGLTEENARALGALTSDPNARPVLLHCSSGNRAGALLALTAFYVDGKSVEEALEIGRAAGLERLEASARAHLERADAAGGAGSAP